MVLVDTNVLLDVVQDDPQWGDWSEQQLRILSRVQPLVINPVIYAEFSLAFESVAAVDRALSNLGIVLREVPRAALFLAGRAFVRYRKAGGTRTNVLPDFFVGAHAAVEGWSLITRDAGRYRRYFPSLELHAPA